MGNTREATRVRSGRESFVAAHIPGADFLDLQGEFSNMMGGGQAVLHDARAKLAILAMIVRMRYGLTETGKEYTLQEVGEVFQVTRERIRQIEERALMKLRNPYSANKLLDFVSKN